MGMTDDRVIAVEPCAVRYRRHHLYDGSRQAGEPHGPALRGVKLTIIEWWAGSEIILIWLEDYDDLMTGNRWHRGDHVYHATPVTTWEQRLFKDDRPIAVPSNYRWECEAPAFVEKMPLLEMIHRRESLFRCPGGHGRDRDQIAQDVYGAA